MSKSLSKAIKTLKLTVSIIPLRLNWVADAEIEIILILHYNPDVGELLLVTQKNLACLSMVG